MLHLHSLGLDKIELNLPKIQRLESTPNININIEQRLHALEKNNFSLENRIIKLEKQNSELQAKLKSFEVNEENKRQETTEQFVDKVSHSTQERECLQKSEINENFHEEYERKLKQLEQADLYLQKTNQIMSDKITAFESMLNISSCSNDETRQQLLSLQNNLELLKTDIECSKFAVENNYYTKTEKVQNNFIPSPKQQQLPKDEKFEMTSHQDQSVNFSNLNIVVS